MIVQAIGLLDDLDKELNTYAMRVREWYGWHFPEMTRVVTDNLQYAKTVCTLCRAHVLPPRFALPPTFAIRPQTLQHAALSLHTHSCSQPTSRKMSCVRSARVLARSAFPMSCVDLVKCTQRIR